VAVFCWNAAAKADASLGAFLSYLEPVMENALTNPKERRSRS
jgi:hypothetical protein